MSVDPLRSDRACDRSSCLFQGLGQTARTLEQEARLAPSLRSERSLLEEGPLGLGLSRKDSFGLGYPRGGDGPSSSSSPTPRFKRMRSGEQRERAALPLPAPSEPPAAEHPPIPSLGSPAFCRKPSLGPGLTTPSATRFSTPLPEPRSAPGGGIGINTGTGTSRPGSPACGPSRSPSVPDEAGGFPPEPPSGGPTTRPSTSRSSRLLSAAGAGLHVRRSRLSQRLAICSPSLFDGPGHGPGPEPPAPMSADPFTSPGVPDALSLLQRCGGGGAGAGGQPAVTTLDQIVVQYLRRQHEQCPSPISVLPTFSLTLPHRCPEVEPVGASPNVARRMMQRQLCPPYGGWRGQRANRHMIYSRFRPWRTYREEEEQHLTVTAFAALRNKLWAGTDAGTIRLLNLNSMEIEGSWDCHKLPVSAIVTYPDPRRGVVMTCGSEVVRGVWQSESFMWATDDLETPLLAFPNLRCPVFDYTGTRAAGLLPDYTGEVYDAEIGGCCRELLR
jgi:hypothetical protein